MYSETFSLLFWTLLSVSLSNRSSSAENISAVVGDNVTLPCRVPENSITAVLWTRTDLQPEYVLMYRDGRVFPDGQHASFRGRVDLQDPQMSRGLVSLVLTNATSNDTGTYHCCVFKEGGKRKKRSCLGSEPVNTIHLTVAASVLTFFWKTSAVLLSMLDISFWSKSGWWKLVLAGHHLLV